MIHSLYLMFVHIKHSLFALHLSISSMNHITLYIIPKGNSIKSFCVLVDWFHNSVCGMSTRKRGERERELGINSWLLAMAVFFFIFFIVFCCRISFSLFFYFLGWKRRKLGAANSKIDIIFHFEISKCADTYFLHVFLVSYLLFVCSLFRWGLTTIYESSGFQEYVRFGPFSAYRVYHNKLLCVK